MILSKLHNEQQHFSNYFITKIYNTAEQFKSKTFFIIYIIQVKGTFSFYFPIKMPLHFKYKNEKEVNKKVSCRWFLYKIYQAEARDPHNVLVRWHVTAVPGSGGLLSHSALSIICLAMRSALHCSLFCCTSCCSSALYVVMRRWYVDAPDTDCTTWIVGSAVVFLDCTAPLSGIWRATGSGLKRF